MFVLELVTCVRSLVDFWQKLLYRFPSLPCAFPPTPLLQVGPTLRVSSASSSFHDHVEYQMLTPFLSLVDDLALCESRRTLLWPSSLSSLSSLVRDPPCRLLTLPLPSPLPATKNGKRLMAVFRALKNGLERLRCHYETVILKVPAVPEDQRDARAAGLSLPYPLRAPHFSPVMVDSRQAGVGLAAPDGTYFGLEPCSAKRLGDPAGDLMRSGELDPTGIADKPVFLALRPAAVLGDPAPEAAGAQPLPVVVKFCAPGEPFAGRVGEAVQSLWAASGLAPRVLETFRLPGGVDMIVTEHLGPKDGWQRLFELLPVPPASSQAESAWALCESAVREALERAHGLELEWEGERRRTVHGDVRIPNIFVRRTDGPAGVEFDVRFIDFDWAGVEMEGVGNGAAVCPPFARRDAFPPVVVPGGRLTQETDAATLDRCLNRLP